MKRIYDSPIEPNIRLMLLKHDIKDLGLSSLPNELQEYHKENGYQTQHFDLKITYDYLSVDDVLKRLLPPGLEIPTSFEQAGHIGECDKITWTIMYF